MVFNAVGDFDEAIVESRTIFSFLHCRSFGIIIACSISIGLTVGQLLPCNSITGHIIRIMTKSDGVCFIRRGLIADGRTVLCGHDCLIAGCQRIFRILTSRSTCNAYRIHTIYTAIIASLVILSISTNRCCSCSKCIVRVTAKGN